MATKVAGIFIVVPRLFTCSPPYLLFCRSRVACSCRSSSGDIPSGVGSAIDPVFGREAHQILYQLRRRRPHSSSRREQCASR